MCATAAGFTRDGRAGRTALRTRLPIGACAACLWEALYMLVSSPAARLRNNTRQDDNHSANRNRCSRGSIFARSICAIIALAVLLLPGAASVYAQANVEGQW